MGNTLDKVSSVKYLGVWITKDVSKICFKAKQIIRLICIDSITNTAILKQLYISSVRPHLGMPLLYAP